jgi:hypothetical protein
MRTRRNGTDMRAEAEKLARALRSGLELRWPILPPSTNGIGPFPPDGNVRAFLTPYADSLHHQQPCRLKLLNRAIRWVRKLVRAVITPWLRVQTHYNLAAVSVIEHLEHRIRVLEDSQRASRQMMQDREKMLRENP